jgi:hypothetical protein
MGEGEKVRPWVAPRSGEAPPTESMAAFYAGHRVRIEARRVREGKSQKVFGRQNVGRVSPRG